VTVAVLMCAAIPLMAPTPPRSPDFSVIVHRGFSERYPENSVAALDAAREAGAPAVEFDVRLTADGRFVVMHDRTLDRTTGCRGEVHRMTFDAVHDCRLRNGERVPSGAAFLHEVSKLRMNAFLEIKDDPLDRWTVDKLGELRAQLRELRMWRRTRLFSFQGDILRRVERAFPELHTVWISRSWPGYGTVAGNADHIALYADDLTRRRVQRLQAMGIQVYGRNSNGPLDWERYRRYRVDGLLLDDVDRYFERR
jgi:glycerophosphoryl diester phosphodiesterase